MRYALWAAVLCFLTFEAAAQTGEALTPKRHFKIEKPGRLSPAEALTVYENVAEQMARGYAASGDKWAKNFPDWRRYNSAPYVSATHGNRYVNNYGNAKTKGYAQVLKGKKMPPGAVFAKDSFTVTRDKSVYAGALFVMEKLEPGRSPKTADWRYTMIMPDGSMFGDTAGDGAENVGFCHSCHATVAEKDYLFYIPKKYRRTFLD